MSDRRRWLDKAWREVEKEVPPGWGWGVAADGPGFVARAHGYRDGKGVVVTAWSQGDRMLPHYDSQASPAGALMRLARLLREGRGEELVDA